MLVDERHPQASGAQVRCFEGRLACLNHELPHVQVAYGRRVEDQLERFAQQQLHQLLSPIGPQLLGQDDHLLGHKCTLVLGIRAVGKCAYLRLRVHDTEVRVDNDVMPYALEHYYQLYGTRNHQHGSNATLLPHYCYWHHCQ